MYFMLTSYEISVFVDQFEDEIYRRTDINSFEEFMIAFVKELYSRYPISIIDVQTQTVLRQFKDK